MKNIIHKIRLFSKSEKEPYLFFYNLLGFYPKKLEYYQLAIRHKSMPIITEDGRELSNERLEFLGDAILNSVVTDIIYKRFQNEQEGFLTNLRSKIVSRQSLNKIAIEIGLDKIVITSKYVNLNSNSNIYGNALEAIFGAIYLDLGYKKCKNFVEDRLFHHFLDWNDILKNERNFKSKIFEWCHKNKIEPEFVLLEEVIIKNKHIFRIGLKIQDKIICEATGSNKKEAEQNASKKAYKEYKNNPDFFT